MTDERIWELWGETYGYGGGRTLSFARAVIAERDRELIAKAETEAKRGVPVRCIVCGRLKKPTGRDSLGSGQCDPDCEGYGQAPHPGDLWVEEVRVAEFAAGWLRRQAE